MHAVNLCDWVGHKDDFCLKMLLAPVINEDAPTVECERGRIDGASAVLNCDDERGSAIVGIARQYYKRHELRFYHSKTGNGGWKRV